MGVSSKQEVTQYTEVKDDKGVLVKHPVLREGDFHVKGTVESSGTRELCRDNAPLAAKVVSLKRSAGGGIDYEFAISAVPGRRSTNGSSPTGKERRGVPKEQAAAAGAAPAAPPPYVKKD
jgi:hypothetical protein